MNHHLILFTRTPLHVGAGSSVGAIDQPIIRERHTGFPIIPASSLKGTFADAWNEGLLQGEGNTRKRITTANGALDQVSDSARLFGSDDANKPFAGALQFVEARLLAFPIRSARGSFAWITCPLLLRRAVRDGLLPAAAIQNLPSPGDEQAVVADGNQSPLDLQGHVVLEEYRFAVNGLPPEALGPALTALLPDDPVWKAVGSRLVILSDGMMSFFARNACEVAQHLTINDATGTAADGLLFNQENVPSETLFYATVHSIGDRSGRDAWDAQRTLEVFADKVRSIQVFQFGGDASTGHGYCSVNLRRTANA